MTTLGLEFLYALGLLALIILGKYRLFAPAQDRSTVCAACVYVVHRVCVCVCVCVVCVCGGGDGGGGCIGLCVARGCIYLFVILYICVFV